MKKPKIKAWAVIQKNWEKMEWSDCLYQQMAAIRGINAFTYAIFEKRKAAVAFKNVSAYRKRVKVVPCTITLN